MKNVKGMTIVQLMLVLLISGILGWFVLDFIIDKRCERDASTPLCTQRGATQKS